MPRPWWESPVPRMIYAQAASYTEYCRAVQVYDQVQNDPVLTRQQEATQQKVNIRIFISFLSPVSALEHSQRLFTMQGTVNAQLDERIRDLEAAVRTLTLTALHPPFRHSSINDDVPNASTSRPS